MRACFCPTQRPEPTVRRRVPRRVGSVHVSGLRPPRHPASERDGGRGARGAADRRNHCPTDRDCREHGPRHARLREAAPERRG